MARHNVSDVRPELPARPEVPPSKIAADFLPKQQTSSPAMFEKTTLVLTPQQTRIQAALNDQTAKLKGQLMGKPVEDDDAKIAKVKGFSESYYG